MKILIVEDEDLAVKKLKKTLMSVDETATVVGEADSIKSTVQWLQDNPSPDLILMDIELADGQSFEIFNHVQVKSPVIFITSYDEYALKAFKVNSVDYLLKPVQKEDLHAALDKYKEMKKMYTKESATSQVMIEDLVKELQQKLQTKEFRKRFLVKLGQKLVSVEVEDIAYFFSDGRLNFFKTFDNSFDSGYRFTASQVEVQLRMDVSLKDKLETLKRYTGEGPYQERVKKLVELLCKDGYLELENDIQQQYKVLASFKYLEQLILSIHISEEVQNEIPQ